jgi:hypothetical protein
MKKYAVVKKGTDEIVRLGKLDFYDSPGKIRAMIKTSHWAQDSLWRWNKDGERESVRDLYEIAEFEIVQTIKTRESL